MPGMADAPRMYRALLKVLPPVLNPYLHIPVEGIEHVPERAPVILACNHLSFID